MIRNEQMGMVPRHGALAPAPLLSLLLLAA
jgi:hypothetical protein